MTTSGAPTKVLGNDTQPETDIRPIAIAIAIGGVITLIIIVIVIITRHIRRSKVDRLLTVGASETHPSKHFERNQGGDMKRTAPDFRPFNGSPRVRIQSLEEGLSGLENCLPSINHGEDVSRPGPSNPERGNDVGREADEDSDGHPSEQATTTHPEYIVRRNSRTPSQYSSAAIPGDGEGDLTFPLPPMTEAWLPKSEEQEHANEPSGLSSSALGLLHGPQNHRTSTETYVQFPASPASDYPPSTYPASTLPPYPDTIRSVTPPPYYYDLSRTQSLRSARSFRSLYDRSRWSRGDIPSMPLPRVQ